MDGRVFWEIDACLQCEAESVIATDRGEAEALIRMASESQIDHGPARILARPERERLLDRIVLGRYRRMIADARSALLSPHECGKADTITVNVATSHDPVMDRAAFDRAVYDAMTRIRTR